MGRPRRPTPQHRLTVRTLSAREAQHHLGIPASTTRTWYQRRNRTGLHAIDYDRRGHPRFAETDLLALRNGKRRVTPGTDHRYGPLGRRVSAADAPAMLGIPKSTVTTWHQRQTRTGLYSAGLDAHRKPFFYEVDLIVLKRGLRVLDDDGTRIHTMKDVTSP